jgi:hypothetical protein
MSRFSRLRRRNSVSSGLLRLALLIAPLVAIVGPTARSAPIRIEPNNLSLSAVDVPSNWEEINARLSGAEGLWLGAIIVFWFAVMRWKRAPAVAARHRIAAKAGFGVTIGLLAGILLTGFLALNRASAALSSDDQFLFTSILIKGALLISGWIGVLTYGISRLVSRLRWGAAVAGGGPFDRARN